MIGPQHDTRRRLQHIALGLLISCAALPGIAQQPKSNPAALIQSLAAMNVSNATLTAEQAVAFKVNLAALSASGTNALPAIREFLQRNHDLYFDGPGGAQLAGAPSLRVGLLSITAKLPPTACIPLFQETLAKTADPREIAMLVKLLSQAEPEKHNAEFVAAARDTLTLAASGKWDGRDVAPLFEVLQQFGGAEAAREFERFANPWFHYAAISLTALPSGAGAEPLLRMARSAEEQSFMGQDAFLRGLAQTALGSTFAADEFVKLTKADKVPATAWPGVAAALMGNTLQFAEPTLSALPPSAARSSTRTVRIASGNQHFLDIAPPDYLLPNELGKRIAYVDRLLEATTNPAVTDALEATRIHLSERLARTK